ncbi:MAG: hypothetical protein HY812_00160 [Planctomycetes bacterium]|nr:hypothetical protein [Planctomycetota bacterium]
MLVRATGADGLLGYGECAPRSYVTGETPETARADLAERLLPAFLGAAFATFGEAAAALAETLDRLPRARHAAFCALELAVLDLAGKTFGVSAGEVLGPVLQDEVRYSGVVSAGGKEEAARALLAIAAFGFQAVKVKVGQDAATDRAVLEAARSLLGERCSLRVDANCAWSSEEALLRIEDLAPFRLDGVEQPLAAGDIAGLAWLTERSPVPIIADESLASLEDARRLVEAGACHHFNVRVSKCGGLINAARIRDLGARSGVSCQLGAQVGETALLSAAGRHFATRSAGVLFLEGSYGTLLLEEDIAREDITIGRGGLARSLPGPGLGVEVDPGRLARFLKAR